MNAKALLKKIIAVPIISVLLLCNFNAVSRGPIKIDIIGDSILQEGTRAHYGITVKNTAKKMLSNITLKIYGHQDQAFACCSVSSDSKQISFNEIKMDEPIIGLMEALTVNQQGQVNVTIEVPFLLSVEDLKTVQLKVAISSPGMKEVVAKKEITIFRHLE